MHKRILGRTGIAVSEVAFGGVEIGMPYGLSATTEGQMLSEKAAIQLVHQSMESGINFFDTARQYGQSESILGKSFKGRRSQVVICSKSKHLASKEGNIPNFRDLVRMINGSLKESLEALKTDYLDVYMLHQVSIPLLQNTDIQDIFLALKAKGIIRAIGVSTYTAEETRIAIESGIWDIIQLPFNLLDQHQKEMFSLARNKGVSIVVRSVLLKGLLSGTYKAHAAPLQVVEDHIRQYKRFLNEGIPDIPTLAIKFALSFEEIGSVLVGLDRPEYLSQAIRSCIGEGLKADTKKSLESLSYPEHDFLNLHQWNVNGWLK